jgi:hypothetical protein
MADITVTARNQCSWGNKSVVTATCASVATAATWPTGLGKVEQLFMQPDRGLTWTWTQAAGVVTFTIGSGPITTCSLEAIGTA